MFGIQVFPQNRVLHRLSLFSFMSMRFTPAPRTVPSALCPPQETAMQAYTIHPLAVGINETDQGVMTYLRNYGNAKGGIRIKLIELNGLIG